MAHTVGPWVVVPKLSGSENHRGFQIVAKPKCFTIINVQPMDEDGIEGEANANLVAAAPDLLKYSKRVMSLLQEYGPSIVPHLMDSDENDGERLREAIRKAEGK